MLLCLSVCRNGVLEIERSELLLLPADCMSKGFWKITLHSAYYPNRSTGKASPRDLGSDERICNDFSWKKYQDFYHLSIIYNLNNTIMYVCMCTQTQPSKTQSEVQISFRTINFLPSATCCRIIRQGLRFKQSPTRDTYKYWTVNRLLYIVTLDIT